MATNQFTCRAWSVALGTAVIGYAVMKEGKPAAAILAVFSATCFWMQDVYYLGLEQAFRAKFETAVGAGQNGTIFDFKIQPGPSDFINAAGSPAVFLVHLPVILLALIVRSNA